MSKLKNAIALLEKATDEAHEKEIWDKALDILEILVERSDTKIDDFLVKPVIGILRRKYDLPDND